MLFDIEYKFLKNFHPKLVDFDNKLMADLIVFRLFYEIYEANLEIFYEVHVSIQVAKVIKMLVKAWYY